MMQTISLPSSLTIETVESFAEELKSFHWEEKPHLTLDASTNESINTTGLQLILSLHKTVQAQGGTLAICGGSESMAHAFKDLGLEGIFTQLSSQTI
jgi:anti-anti-sigma regulatory factor